jgi:hypothetical protein
MKKISTFVLSICILMFSSSCQKESSTSTLDDSMSKVRDIVGGSGNLIALNEKDINDIPLLSIDEFRMAYKEFNSPKKFTGIAELKQNENTSIVSVKKTSSTTAYDEYEDDGPRPAGYYHASFPFYVSYYTSINNNIMPHGFYTMHLDFNTDQFGRVIGNPTISFTGIGFFSWTYVNASQINFNTSNTTSTFTITGNNLFGIQLGGLTLGWTNRSNYFFTVNMDSDYKQDAVKVEQK